MHDPLTALVAQKVLSILRLDDPQQAEAIIELSIQAGLRTQEVTLTTPGALKLINSIKKRYADAICLGVGTVLTTEQCQAASAQGADFAVTPNLNLNVLRECQKLKLPVIPGVFTPSEMQLAHEEGANAIKLFPVSCLGPGFIKAVRAPLPHLRIVAVGGVNLENAKDYLNAGAIAVGVGTQVFGSLDLSSSAARTQMVTIVQRLLAM